MGVDNRLDLRITPAFKAAVRAEAERRGQSLTVFTERALEAALSASETTEPREISAKGYARKGTGPQPPPWPAIVADTKGGLHALNCKCPVCRPKGAKR